MATHRKQAKGTVRLRIAASLACAALLAFGAACAGHPVQDDSAAEDTSLFLACSEIGFEHGRAADQAQQSACAPDLPAVFDLRDRGVVTPVKSQNPWGTCWAFATLAAAETSALSATGATYGETGLDFSEKHLSWFPFYPIDAAESETQKGEGLTLFDNEEGNDPFHVGLGYSSLITSLLATEGGPADESEFPYRGTAGVSQAEFFYGNPERAKEIVISEIEKREGTSFEEYIAANYPWSSCDEALEAEYEAFCAYYQTEDFYTTEDDWSIAATDETGMPNRSKTGAYVLSDANRLPQLCERDGGAWTAVSATGMEAVKRELADGRGVAVCIAADQSVPGIWSETVYMNTDTWAHYTYEDAGIDHEVCIVGWDDTYSLWNFNEGHRPPGDGAWIAKNSWGSETDWTTSDNGTTIGSSPWGTIDENGLHTGYFYISYYDKSLTDPVSFAFDDDPRGAQSIMQYDYLPGIAGTYGLSSFGTISEANVFTAPADGTICAAATATSSADMHVRFDIYLLDGDTTDPTEGTLAAQQWQKFACPGFHRLELANPVAVGAGQRFAVVCTAFDAGENGAPRYHASASMDDGEEAARTYYEADAASTPFYATAVVNPGESLLYQNGKWQDWVEYLENRDNSDGRVVDNFPIKAYLTASE